MTISEIRAILSGQVENLSNFQRAGAIQYLTFTYNDFDVELILLDGSIIISCNNSGVSRHISNIIQEPNLAPSAGV